MNISLIFIKYPEEFSSGGILGFNMLDRKAKQNIKTTDTF